MDGEYADDKKLHKDLIAESGLHQLLVVLLQSAVEDRHVHIHIDLIIAEAFGLRIICFQMREDSRVRSGGSCVLLAVGAVHLSRPLEEKAVQTNEFREECLELRVVCLPVLLALLGGARLRWIE